jgi:serine phosphatase RsbU (regulator of sigma subunit)
VTQGRAADGAGQHGSAGFGDRGEPVTAEQHDDGVDRAAAADVTAELCDPRRLAALTETGLGAGPDPELDRVAEQVRQLLRAPVALVSLVTPQAQVFPGAAGLGEPWSSTRTTPLSHSFCQHVVATAVPLVVTDARTDPRVRDNLAVPDLGVLGYAGVPLVDAQGEVLGSLAAIDTAPRIWSAAELELLAVLGQGCSARLQVRIAGRDAERERARRDSAEHLLRGAYERSQLLLHASEALTRAGSLEEIRAIVTDLVIGEVKPSYVGLTVREDSHWLRRIDDPAQPVGPETGAELASLDAPTPAALTAREGALRLYPDEDALASAFPPDTQHAYGNLGLRSLACAPLRDGPDVIGTLLFGWDVPHTVDLLEQVVFGTLASYVSHALLRAAFVQQRIHVAHQLQDALLTSVPAVPGISLAARYRPAAADERVGGDWYDTLELPGDGSGKTVAITVGDITGHDVRAAALMGQVRSMARQATWERRDGAPSAVVEALERSCADLGVPATGTLVHAHVRFDPDRPEHWRMRWANAGHPPPLLLRRDGRISDLDQHDLMFGVPELRHGRGLHDHAVDLGPGDTVLFYTDGLVERRDQDIDTGIALAGEHLRRLQPRILAARTGSELEAVLDELITAVTSDDRDDDVAVLALRTALDRN